MAILWMDGFDRYGATADLSLNWSVVNFNGGIDFVAGGGVNGGGCVQLDQDQRLDKSISSTLTAGGNVHAAFWYRTGSIGNVTIFVFQTNLFNGTSTSAPYLSQKSDGALAVNSHGVNFGTHVATSAAGAIIATNTWYHIEYAAKYNTAGNGGFIKVWVNGNLVINFSGTTLSGSVPTTWSVAGPVSWAHSEVHRFDDIVLWDEVGTDFVHTQLSASYLPYIETLSPDANDSVQFTPSAGSNFQNVDDAAFHDSDSTYNESITVGHVDLFTIANMAGGSNAWFAIGVKTVAKLNVPGIVSYRDRIDSNGTVVESSSRSLTTSYVTGSSFFGKNPDGTVAWTEAAINALKTGYEYQS